MSSAPADLSLQPIRSFYSCYLLQSLKRPSVTYIGSTPNPPRRLAQHNRIVIGGAWRTRRDTQRPWEMICLVYGFPTRIAALQFEWAWDHPSKTRKIPSVLKPMLGGKSFMKRRKRRRIREKRTLDTRLKALWFLLRCRGFSRWPLKVAFLNKDVYKSWRACLGAGEKEEKDMWEVGLFGNLYGVGDADGGMSRAIRSGIRIALDTTAPDPKTVYERLQAQQAQEEDDMEEEACNKKGGSFSTSTSRLKKYKPTGGIYSLDVTYRSLEPHLQKSFDLLQQEEEESQFSGLGDTSLHCQICSSPLHHPHEKTVICPQSQCTFTSCLGCLGDLFLTQEEQTNKAARSLSLIVAAKKQLVPIEGTCPGCKKSIQWIDVTKELSLRNHLRRTNKSLNTASLCKTQEEEDDELDMEMNEEEEDEDDELGSDDEKEDEDQSLSRRHKVAGSTKQKSSIPSSNAKKAETNTRKTKGSTSRIKEGMSSSKSTKNKLNTRSLSLSIPSTSGGTQLKPESTNANSSNGGGTKRGKKKKRAAGLAAVVIAATDDDFSEDNENESNEFLDMDTMDYEHIYYTKKNTGAGSGVPILDLS